MIKNLLILFAICFTYTLQAQSYSEDFESFNVGDYIGVVGDNWTTWSGTTGTSEDAKIVSDKAKSGENSIYFYGEGTGGGPQDVVLEFGDKYSTGVFTLKFSIYIPEGSESYMNLQGETVIGTTWSSNLYFLTNNQLDVDAGNDISTLYNYDVWNDVTYVMDLDNDIWTISVNGECAGTLMGTDAVASLDIFPLSSTTGLSEFWIDDISYNYVEDSPTLDSEFILTVDGGLGITGTQQSLTGRIMNAGPDYTGDINISIESDAGTEMATFEDVSISNGDSYEFTLEDVFEVEDGLNELTINLDLDDDNTCSNQVITGVNGVTPAQDKRVIAEEATGTWCQWCPRGAVYMERMAEAFGDYFVGVAVHNSDPMEFTIYDDWIGTQIGGYPQVVVDRTSSVDPSLMQSPLVARLTEETKSTFDIQAQYDEETGMATAKIVVNAKKNIVPGADLFCIIVEDDVTGSGAGWAQVNAYAGGGNGAMGGYENLPNPVPADKMVYEDVARMIMPDAEGLQLPDAILEGNYNAYEFEFEIADDWDVENVKIVALLVTNGATGEADNAMERPFLEAVDAYVSNQEIEYTSELDIFPNPSQGESTIKLDLEESTNVEVTILNVSGQQVAYRDYGLLNGNQMIQLKNLNLANGVYTVLVKTDNKVANQKLIIQK